MEINVKKYKKTGIMGGTFNPVHNGHLLLASKAFEMLELDKVLFIPTGNSYMKKNVLAAQRRVDMVRLAIEPYQHFELSLIEVEREGNSYTCDTLEYLTTEKPDTCYYLIMGADSLFQIERWRQPEKIFSFSKIVCAVRDDYDIDKIMQKGKQLNILGADIIYLNIPKIDISSTDIRAKVKKQLSIKEYVPGNVADYIQQEHLYYEED